jgi:hypothetical protein
VGLWGVVYESAIMPRVLSNFFRKGTFMSSYTLHKKAIFAGFILQNLWTYFSDIGDEVMKK